MQCCVRPFEFLEVYFQAIGKCFPAHQEDQLFHQASTFTVSDSIYQRFRYIGVCAICLDFVVSWTQIIWESPSLVVGEMKPWFILEILDIVASCSTCIVRQSRGKSLIEPQVVPPLHGHQVAEPHVAELVLDNHAEEGHLGDRHILRRAHDAVTVSDAPNVFHCSVFVIWAHHVVQLGEWVSLAKILLIIVHGGLRHSEDEFMSQVFYQRFPDEYSLGRVHWVIILKECVRPGADGVEVCRNLRCLFELVWAHGVRILVEVHEPHAIELFKHPLAVEHRIFVPGIDSIRNCPPHLWASHAKCHLGLKTRLVEAWEDSEAMESLKLRIQVLFTIRLVNELMQARPILLIRSEVLEAYHIPALLQVRDFQPNLLMSKILLLHFWIFIDSKFRYRQSLWIQKELSIVFRQSLKVKVDLCLSKIVVSFLKSQGEGIFYITDQLSSLPRFHLREQLRRRVLWINDDFFISEHGRE